MGEELLLGDSFTLLAMIYYLFFSVNSLTFYSMSTLNQASAVIYRLSEVFRMEEHERTRSEHFVDGEPAIDIKGAEYAWGFCMKSSKGESSSFRAKTTLKNIETSVLKGITVEL